MPVSDARNPSVFTVGHATHSLAEFLGLLGKHGVTAVADVRSAPYSRFNPHFNRETLARDLEAAGVRYFFLGGQLGGKPRDLACYEGGRVNYERVRETEAFRKGLDRVIRGAQEHRIALMCAEKDPLGCHRTRLVSFALARQGVEVAHILGNGDLEPHRETEDRLLEQAGLAGSLLAPREERIAEAVRLPSTRRKARMGR